MKGRRVRGFALVLAMVVGLLLLLYPPVSDWWNSFHQSQAVRDYVARVDDMDDATYQGFLEGAREYNRKLAEEGPEAMLTRYSDLYARVLDISGDGSMGYLEIPGIGVSLPIYHGTSADVLQSSVGHLPWSSVPIGGESTHSVLSGHRGLPSSRLFTDLDKLAVGDFFTVHVLRESMTYEVDQILIVDPDDTSALRIEPGQDLCTLVTCTPYGINTHRLLVRGHRVADRTVTPGERVSSDAMLVEPLAVAPFFFAVLAAAALAVGTLVPRIRRTRRGPVKRGEEGEDETD